MSVQFKCVETLQNETTNENMRVDSFLCDHCIIWGREIQRFFQAFFQALSFLFQAFSFLFQAFVFAFSFLFQACVQTVLSNSIL